MLRGSAPTPRSGGRSPAHREHAAEHERRRDEADPGDRERVERGEHALERERQHRPERHRRRGEREAEPGASARAVEVQAAHKLAAGGYRAICHRDENPTRARRPAAAGGGRDREN